MIKRRQSLLAVMAVVLILASIGTGYLGFVYDPGEDVPGGSPLPTGVNPVSATATGATEETTVGTEATAPAAVETTEATRPSIDETMGGVYNDGGEVVSPSTSNPAKPTGEDTGGDKTIGDNTDEDKTIGNGADKDKTVGDDSDKDKTVGDDSDKGKTVGNDSDKDKTVGKNLDPKSSTVVEGTSHSDAFADFFTSPPTAAEETAPTNSEDTIPTVTSEPVALPRKSAPGFRLVMQIACFVFAAGACVDILLLAMLRKNVRDHECSGEQPMEPPTPAEVHPVPITKETVEETVCPIPGISLGKIHDIGRRDYQQDSFGQTAVLRNTGILAVLADGMGGLSGGERVSQKIVMEALTFGSTLQANQVPTALPGMVAGINRAVNQMLGPKGLYTSGSTVVSALITGNALRWISVGDSRVYLYRDGQISQLSRDHDLLQDWMPDILEGKRSMAEALRDPNGRKLTSFIGMGELRHVDYNRTPIPLLPGDRVLLMSDGVYGTVSDAEMAAILRDCGSVQLAASHIGQRIMGAALPYQDNYTLIVLGYDPPDQPRNNR